MPDLPLLQPAVMADLQPPQPTPKDPTTPQDPPTPLHSLLTSLTTLLNPRTSLQPDGTPSPTAGTFRATHTTAARVSRSHHLLTTRPTHIPILLTLPSGLESQKAVFGGMAFGAFAFHVRKRLAVPKHKALFFLVGGQLPVVSMTVAQVYQELQDFDGFLYVTVCEENCFGSWG